MPSPSGKEFSARLMGRERNSYLYSCLKLKEGKKGKAILKRASGRETHNVCRREKVTDCSIEAHFVGGPTPILSLFSSHLCDPIQGLSCQFFSMKK